MVITEFILKSWEKVIIEELVLTGDIKEPMRDRLEKSIFEGPFPNDVATHLREYNSLAEHEFEHGNYGTARQLWAVVKKCWI